MLKFIKKIFNGWLFIFLLASAIIVNFYFELIKYFSLNEDQLHFIIGFVSLFIFVFSIVIYIVIKNNEDNEWLKADNFYLIQTLYNKGLLEDSPMKKHYEDYMEKKKNEQTKPSA